MKRLVLSAIALSMRARSARRLCALVGGRAVWVERASPSMLARVILRTLSNP